MTPWANPWLAAAATLVAVYRLTRLVTADSLTQKPRDQIIRWAYLHADHDPELVAEDVPGSGTLQAMAEADGYGAPKLAALIVCRWCAGVWVGAAAVAAEWAIPAVWGPVAWGLTLASGAALLAGLEQ